jgi:hypothetical protein
MRYIKEILKKNRIWVLVYIGLGIFNAFMANYKSSLFHSGTVYSYEIPTFPYSL